MRYNDVELKRFWKAHELHFRQLDLSQDPDGLTSICFQGEPLWYNRYFDFWQKRMFRKALRKIPVHQGDPVLDVGCGFGRWSRILASRGFRVTGVDIQEEAVLYNRRLLPNCQFHLMPAEQISQDELGSFQFACSVTVLQHLPFATQEEVVHRLFSCLKPGGYAIHLEEIWDASSPHVFSRSSEEWKQLFEQQGFRVRECWGYRYLLLLRAVRWIKRLVVQGGGDFDALTPEECALEMARFPERRSQLWNTFLKLVITASYPVEAISQWILPKAWAGENLFILQKPAELPDQARWRPRKYCE